MYARVLCLSCRLVVLCLSVPASDSTLVTQGHDRHHANANTHHTQKQAKRKADPKPQRCFIISSLVSFFFSDNIHDNISMSGNIGVPIKLLYEAEGMKITVEMKKGEIYRGLLLGAEDTMNVSLSDVLRTARNGKVTKLPNVYLRGSSIRFIALPNLLKSAPIFQKVSQQKRKMEEAAAAKQGVSSKKRKLGD